MDWLGLLPELVVVAGSLILLVGAATSPRTAGTRTLLPLGTVATLVLALVVLFLRPGLGGELSGGMLVLDPFAFFFRAVFLGVGLLVALLSLDFLSRRAPGRGEFWPLLLWGVLGMMLMVTSRNLLVIYLGLELVSLCSYVLAGYFKEDARSVEAAIKYFLTGAVASAVLLFGISLLYGVAGSTSLDSVSATLGAAGLLGYAALLFLVAGFGFKVAAAPLHMWAPDAYEGAPAPVTGFFSVGPKAAAFAALLRVFFVGMGPLHQGWTAVFALLSVLSMFMGNLAALPQNNIKRMMAYSAIAHAGYILVGLAMGTPLGATALVYYLLAYVFANLGVFAVIVAVSYAGLGEEVSSFSGLARRAPILAWAMVIYFLSLIGIPPTAGFFGKFYLFSAAIQRGQVWLAILMVLNSVISVGYYYRVVRDMFLSEPQSEAGPRAAAAGKPQPTGAGPAAVSVRVPAALQLVVGVTALLTLGIGLGLEYFLHWARLAVSVLP